MKPMFRLMFIAIIVAPSAPAYSWEPVRKKLIHAGYPARVEYVSKHIGAMNALPFDGTILVIDKLKTIFNYPRKIAEAEVQPLFDTLAATEWGKLTENFLQLQVDSFSDIDWFNDAQWENVEHNIRLATRAVVVGKARGLVFDPEQYDYPLWRYAKAQHRQTKSFAEYHDQMRKRGAQWIRAVQSVKPDITILHYYLWTAFPSYYNADQTDGANATEMLKDSSYGLYHGFLNGMLDAVGPDVVLVDGNEPAYYYAGQAAYDQGYVQMKQERLYLVARENRDKFRRQVQAGMSIYIQGTMGMRNYSIQALGSLLSPEERLKLLEHRTYHALRSCDEYTWCYSDSKHINWWTNQVPAGAAAAIASAKKKVAAGQPLGFSEVPFVAAKQKQLRIFADGRASVVPRQAMIEKVSSGAAPVIDGKLDDAIWQRAERLEDFTLPNIFVKDRLEAPTIAQVAWDDDNLYVAFTCMEPNIDQLSARASQHDGKVWNDDCVEVFINAGRNLYPYRHFEVNSKDTHFDATWVSFKNMDGNWNADWRSRSIVADDRWTTELAIPWKVIGKRPMPGETRRANLTRHRIANVEETTTWTPMYKTFSDADYLGTWKFVD